MSPSDSSISFAIDRRRAEFADPAFEDRFIRHFLPLRNAQLKGSLLFAAGFYIVFGVTDITTLGFTAIAWVLIALRVLVALVALGGYCAVDRHPDSVPVSILASSGLLVVAMGVFMVVCWFQPGTLAWNVMSLALIVMAVYVTFPNRFLYAVAIGIGSSAAFSAMLWVQGLLKPDDLLTLALLLVMGNALGCIAASRCQVAQREQFRSSYLLHQLADRDPLTGCYNRRVLQKGLLEAELARSRRHGTAVAVILCDIDHFKRINDEHGHAAGDRILADFAGLLRAMTRDGADSVVRYGGEEFLVVLPGTELDGARALAERIRRAFAGQAASMDDGTKVFATASFGIAAVPARHADVPATCEALIAIADAQLYAVKRGGRNGVQGSIASGTSIRAAAAVPPSPASRTGLHGACRGRRASAGPAGAAFRRARR
ncbi:GGDEF domain-containing protein [Massilia sp. METH4]|uniref:GGDEF domain-containing protein n=1 Tax=Massilia sp. METH4 TaxID=3123041 RepID=UPI0030CC0490